MNFLFWSKPFSFLFVFICSISLAFTQNFTIQDLKGPSEDKFEGEFCSFSAQISNPKGDNLTFAWDFGDGTSASLMDRTSAGHAFNEPGDFQVRLKVTSLQSGASQSKTIKINIKNSGPSIKYLSGIESAALNVNFYSVAYDHGNEEKLTYTWDFGDGTLRSNQKNMPSTAHQYKKAGTYTITLTVSDEQGGSSKKSYTLAVGEKFKIYLSGGINEELEMNTGFVYMEKEGQCFESFFFYDEVKRSWLSITRAEGDSVTSKDKAITHRIINPDENNPQNLYFATLVHRMDAQTFQFYVKSNRALENLPTGEDANANPMSQMPGGNFNFQGFNPTNMPKVEYALASTSGELEIQPYKGGSELKLAFKIEMKGQKLDLKDRQSLGKEVRVSVRSEPVVKVELTPSAKYTFLNGKCRIDLPPFRVEDHTPQEDAYNINPENPCFQVQFSDAVDLTTLNENTVQLYYYNEQTQQEKIPLRFSPVNENLIEFVPDKPLLKSVKYDMKILGGDQGVKSLTEQTLSQNYQWRFQTLVDIDTQEIRVYQTLADLPLLQGKEAMARIKVGWSKPDGVGEVSFVDKFPASVVLKNDQGGLISNVVGEKMIKHPSLYSKEDERQARNTINVFGWKPEKSDGELITAEITPIAEPCEELVDETTFELEHAVSYDNSSSKLIIDYYLINMGDWEEFAPDSEVKGIRKAMREFKKFAQQLFPLKQIVISGPFVHRPRYPTIVEAGSNAIVSVLLNGVPEFYTREDMANSIAEADRGKADIVIGFTPLIDKWGRSGKAMVGTDRVSGRRIPIIHMTYIQSIIEKALLEHELGHALGLQHTPTSNTVAQRDMAEKNGPKYYHDNDLHTHMNGFRIYHGENRGANKNCDEGNAESDLGVVNLMFPSHKTLVREDVFVDAEQYAKARKYLARRSKTGLYDGKKWNQNIYYASLKPQGKIAQTDSLLKIVGKIDKEGTQVAINEIYFDDNAPFNPFSSGKKLEVKLLSTSGKILNEQVVPLKDLERWDLAHVEDPIDFDYKGWQSFQLSLPFNRSLSPAELILSYNEKVLFTYSLSSSDPSIQITEPASTTFTEDQISLRWQSEDSDSPKLIHYLSYSPNGVDQWQILEQTEQREAKIHLKNLMSGPAPTFRIEAFDGLNRATDYMSFSYTPPLSVVSVDPATKDPSQSIYISFSDPLAAKCINSEYFSLGSFNSGDVPVEVMPTEDETTIRLIPQTRLFPDEDYSLSMIAPDSAPSKQTQEEKAAPKRELAVDPNDPQSIMKRLEELTQVDDPSVLMERRAEIERLSEQLKNAMQNQAVRDKFIKEQMQASEEVEEENEETEESIPQVVIKPVEGKYGQQLEQEFLWKFRLEPK